MTHTGGGCGASESFGQRDDFAHSLGDKARICVKYRRRSYFTRPTPLRETRSFWHAVASIFSKRLNLLC
ncbi:unnamed protein product [Pylaiella littoralis]